MWYNKIERVINMNQNNEIIIDDDIINIDNYKNEIFDDDTVNKLLKSEEDIENGRTRDAIEVMKEFKVRYGF